MQHVTVDRFVWQLRYSLVFAEKQRVPHKRTARNTTEIEKGLSGSKSSGQTDGGTGSRVMGTLLTWMNDKQSEVYIVATSNDVTALPPELLRKGRFDEIFFVDLPNEAERETIFKIHLTKRKRDAGKFDMSQLVGATDGYTGAEIEQVIIDAMFVAYGSGKKDVTTADILTVIGETSPLSVINSSQIERLRQWSTNRCRNASTQKKQVQVSVEQKTTGRKIKIGA